MFAEFVGIPRCLSEWGPWSTTLALAKVQSPGIWLLLAIGYLFTIATSGHVVRHFIGERPKGLDLDQPDKGADSGRYDVGAVIGKCENILTITLILADALTGLALVFTAKSIVRSEQIKKAPKYYLGGTLVNFTYSVMMGFLLRVLVS